MSLVRLSAGIVLQIASSALFSNASLAQSAALSPYPGGVVIAKSRFGNGTMQGQVRHARLGWEVRLPGGRWVYCRRSCSETLRVETVDFFESNAAGSGQLTNECGIFGCLNLKYAR
jgi:hypothetical protein